MQACKNSSQLFTDLNCESIAEEVTVESDFENKFTIPVPKTWKINLYYDNAQSSIYFADTTKQLTETMIVDVTFIKQKTSFDKAFLKKIQENYGKAGLQEAQTKEFELNTYTSYYTIAKGMRNNFPYTICNVFIGTNREKLIHAKLEVYGDSLVNNRLCKGINLIEKIHFK
jgi:hypothetical protein